MRRAVVAALLLVALAGLTGCGDDDAPRSAPQESADPTATSTVDLPAGCPTPLAEMDRDLDEGLRTELLAMLKRDQAGRTGGVDDEGDSARTERLREIIEEHGWPGTDLVGDDGEDAAWAIAQHSDLDPDFQRCALAHLTAAVDLGVASPGNLAYLTDRVAVADGEPQTYGTQVTCTRKGPEPRTPLADPDRVEALREEAGLPSYRSYLREMTEACAA